MSVFWLIIEMILIHSALIWRLHLSEKKMFSFQHKIHKEKGVELSELDEQVAQV